MSEAQFWKNYSLTCLFPFRENLPPVVESHLRFNPPSKILHVGPLCTSTAKTIRDQCSGISTLQLTEHTAVDVLEYIEGRMLRSPCLLGDPEFFRQIIAVAQPSVVLQSFANFDIGAFPFTVITGSMSQNIAAIGVYGMMLRFRRRSEEELVAGAMTSLQDCYSRALSTVEEDGLTKAARGQGGRCLVSLELLREQPTWVEHPSASHLQFRPPTLT